MTPPFRVLIICTANIGRSPFTERLLRCRLGERLGPSAERIEVTSAGTWALVGHPIDPPMVTLLNRLGGDGVGFAARQVTERLIGEADLVLTASREHRAAVVTLVPAAVKRTFTLPEFARLVAALHSNTADLPADPAERLRQLVRRVVPLRGTVGPAYEGEDDVKDPYGGPPEGYFRAGERMGVAVERIVSALAA